MRFWFLFVCVFNIHSILSRDYFWYKIQLGITFDTPERKATTSQQRAEYRFPMKRPT